MISNFHVAHLYQTADRHGTSKPLRCYKKRRIFPMRPSFAPILRFGALFCRVLVDGCLLRRSKVVAIIVHYLAPRRCEVLHEPLLRVVTGIDFRQRTELRVRTEDEIDASAGPFDLARLTIPPLIDASVEEGCQTVFMSSKLTKKSLVSVPGCLVKTPCFDCPKLVFRTRIPPMRTVISGAVSLSNCALSTSNSSGDVLFRVLT